MISSLGICTNFTTRPVDVKPTLPAPVTQGPVERFEFSPSVAIEQAPEPVAEVQGQPIRKGPDLSNIGIVDGAGELGRPAYARLNPQSDLSGLTLLDQLEARRGHFAMVLVDTPSPGLGGNR